MDGNAAAPRLLGLGKGVRSERGEKTKWIMAKGKISRRDKLIVLPLGAEDALRRSRKATKGRRHERCIQTSRGAIGSRKHGEAKTTNHTACKGTSSVHPVPWAGTGSQNHHECSAVGKRKVQTLLAVKGTQESADMMLPLFLSFFP